MRVIILIDAMGGDNAPDAVIKASIKAIEEIDRRDYFNWK